MNIRQIREEMRMGRSVFDLPLRVTYYARVSTEKPEQQGSLENQRQYYTELIRNNPNWTYVEGYADEGISGTSTCGRESFLRMISDAHAGAFDFIVTKEISRFSRSTLDSIRYTQELLDAEVGVLFQNDNINTLESDSEFRLTVMAGVAQDEVRKLSERLQFGFRQSIRNGRVLGNSRIWGYGKKDGTLSVDPEQAEAVRLIFSLYATGGFGLRTLAQELTARGFTSRTGNPFSAATVGRILQNPKYKGWYCGNKTKSLDYRRKKTVFLPETEWVCHPDPAVPALVPEALWERANAIFRARSAETRARGAGYHNRYPYSGKLVCGIHGTAFHRQAFRTETGQTEFWKCRVSREQGKAGCCLPAVYTAELDRVLEAYFAEQTDRERLAQLTLRVLREADGRAERAARAASLSAQMQSIEAKKEKLLELSIAGALTAEEFMCRNERFNVRLAELDAQRRTLEAPPESDLTGIGRAVYAELSFADGVSSALTAAILDHAVVCPESDGDKTVLELHFRNGGTAKAAFRRRPFCLL